MVINCPEFPFSAVLLKVDRKFQSSHTNMYDITRGHWKASLSRIRKAKYALAIVNQQIKEVFEVEQWQMADQSKHPGRVEFIGKEAPESLKSQYINKSVRDCYSGGSNPVKYMNC